MAAARAVSGRHDVEDGGGTVRGAAAEDAGQELDGDQQGQRGPAGDEAADRARIRGRDVGGHLRHRVGGGHFAALTARELRRRRGSGSPSTKIIRFAWWDVRPTRVLTWEDVRPNVALCEPWFVIFVSCACLLADRAAAAGPGRVPSSLPTRAECRSRRERWAVLKVCRFASRAWQSRHD